MAAGDSGTPSGAAHRRQCARRGCANPVKKATAKYCSVQCCSIDPERLERLRTHAKRANARALPMTHQLSLALPASTYDPEAQLARLSGDREDVPRGMSRLAG